MTTAAETHGAAPAQLMTPRDVAAACKVSLRQFYRLVSAGRAPEPIRLGPQCVRYRPSDVAEWIARGCAPAVEHRRPKGARKS